MGAPHVGRICNPSLERERTDCNSVLHYRIYAPAMLEVSDFASLLRNQPAGRKKMNAVAAKPSALAMEVRRTVKSWAKRDRIGCPDSPSATQGEISRATVSTSADPSVRTKQQPGSQTSRRRSFMRFRPRRLPFSDRSEGREIGMSQTRLERQMANDPVFNFAR